MQKNEIRTGSVIDIGSNGEGIIKDEGQVVFVPFAITGEEVEYKVLKVDKKCAYGKLIRVLSSAKCRREPKCSVFNKCGGCQLQHIAYNEQLKIKEKSIKDCFRKIAGLEVEVNPSITGDDEFRYRNKLQLPVGKDLEGNTVIGFYANNSHRIVPINDCLINPEWTKTIIKVFSDFINRFNIEGYDERTFKGELREITVKEVKGKLIIVTVITTNKLRNSNELLELLKMNLDCEFSLFINVNNTRSNVIYGEKFIKVYGEDDFTATMLGIEYRIGVLSFMQVNSVVCEKLYSSVREKACLTKDTVVIDAYSGAGLMTALLSKGAKQAIGIEIIPEAVECANLLAIDNKLTDKIRNYQGKCEDILPDIIDKISSKNKDICLVLDPPRKGCDFAVINSIIKSDVDRIIYVSCLPSTLSRDIGLLVGSLEVKNGEIKKAENFTPRFRIESVQPFDMFANTKHVETMVTLRKN